MTKIPKKEMQNAPIGELLKSYAAAAAAHGEATEKGDYRVGNKQHDIIVATYREIRARGLEAQRSLFGLLDHPNEAVRLVAAAHALEFAPEEGATVLELLAKGTSIHGFSARITLEEWKKGSLKFP
ncbi:MAG: DUF2019 domain-containing protein [Limisphaerales bacterium]